MIAVDTCSFIAYLNGLQGKDVDLIEEQLSNSRVIMPPCVLAELLSSPTLSTEMKKFFNEFPTMELLPGYWKRTGLLRASVIAKKRKARLGDALITQFCLDHRLALVTRDTDYKVYEGAGLRVL